MATYNTFSDVTNTTVPGGTDVIVVLGGAEVNDGFGGVFERNTTTPKSGTFLQDLAGDWFRKVTEESTRVNIYTPSTVPNASTAGKGAIIYVDDGSGNGLLLYSDGTDWLRASISGTANIF